MNSFGFGGVNGHVILEPYIDENKEEFVQGTLVTLGITLLKGYLKEICKGLFCE